MIRWLQKRLALRRYRRELGPSLVARYGRERHYTVNQVRKTAEVLGLNTDYLCYAYADYCSRADFDAHHASTGETCDWEAMREEIASSWGVGHHALAGHHGHQHDDHADHGAHHHHDHHHGGGHHD